MIFKLKKLYASNKKNAYALVDDDVFDVIQEMGLKFGIQSNEYFQSTSHNIKLPGMAKKKRLGLHVFVWILKTGEEPSLEIDHIDFNKSNNQFKNFRLATRQQQCQHREKRKSNSSGYTGISHYHSHKKNKNGGNHYWRARIQNPDGKEEIEYFDYDDKGLLEAVHWRDAKVKQYHGEFAVLNFPDENK